MDCINVRNWLDGQEACHFIDSPQLMVALTPPKPQNHKTPTKCLNHQCRGSGNTRYETGMFFNCGVQTEPTLNVKNTRCFNLMILAFGARRHVFLGHLLAQGHKGTCFFVVEETCTFVPTTPLNSKKPLIPCQNSFQTWFEAHF